jgi:hypothetical protein
MSPSRTACGQTHRVMQHVERRGSVAFEGLAWQCTAERFCRRALRRIPQGDCWKAGDAGPLSRGPQDRGENARRRLDVRACLGRSRSNLLRVQNSSPQSQLPAGRARRRAAASFDWPFHSEKETRWSEGRGRRVGGRRVKSSAEIRSATGCCLQERAASWAVRSCGKDRAERTTDIVSNACDKMVLRNFRGCGAMLCAAQGLLRPRRSQRLCSHLRKPER